MEQNEAKCKKCRETYYINPNAFEMLRQDDMDADFYHRRDQIIRFCPKCRPKNEDIGDIISYD